MIEPNHIMAAQSSVVRGIEEESVIKAKTLPLANMCVYDITAQKQAIDTGRNYLTSNTNTVFISTLVSGQATITQGNSEFNLVPGELAIFEQSADFTIYFEQSSRHIMLEISEDIFNERLNGRKNEVFEPRKLNDAGLVPVIATLLKSLATEVHKMSETDQYTLTNTLIELAGASIRAAAIQPENQQHDSQVKLFQRILAYMEQNYADCELSPKVVAEANGISIRYLHRLFQQSGMAVSKWIWERRLKAAREDITNPEKTAMRISEIAFLHGFNDPAHFSRSFRDRFNISPSKLRTKMGEEHEQLKHD
jgi:AraC-like DNA-binding protein